MNRSDIIKNLSSEFDSINNKVVEEMVKTVFNEISNALAEGKSVQLRKYMNFSTKLDHHTMRRNPKTGHTFRVKKCKRVTFKPGIKLKTSVRNYNTDS
ncbi:MAG: HU family DNA-binding protein [Rhodobacteraceae bacterium]|nr:HU family DNA-binding protein [Paracoccaceae bacterium]